MAPSRPLASVPSSAHELGVEHPLVGGVEPDDRVADLAVHVRDRVLHALAAVAVLAVAELDGLVRAGAGAARHRGPAPGAGDQLDLDLDGRVAAGVQDLPRRDVIDDAQVNSCCEWCEGSGSNPGNGGERAFVVPWRPGPTCRADLRRFGVNVLVRTGRRCVSDAHVVWSETQPVRAGQARRGFIQAACAAAHARVMPQSNIWNACGISGSTNRSTLDARGRGPAREDQRVVEQMVAGADR